MEEEETLTLQGYYDLTGDLLVSIVAMDRNNKYLKERTVASKKFSWQTF